MSAKSYTYIDLHELGKGKHNHQAMSDAGIIPLLVEALRKPDKPLVCRGKPVPADVIEAAAMVSMSTLHELTKNTATHKEIVSAGAIQPVAELLLFRPDAVYALYNLMLHTTASPKDLGA